jgi:flagella basal body P-ring formation protein FlgA
VRLLLPFSVILLLGVALRAAPSRRNGPRKIEIIGASLCARDLLTVTGTPPVTGTRGPSPGALEAAIVEGLRPGEEREITPAQVKLRLAELGIGEELALAELVIVRRRSRLLPASELAAAGEEAIREALKAAPEDEVAVSPLSPPRSLLAPVTPYAIETTLRRPALPGGLWTAEVVARSDDWTESATVRYRVKVTAQVLVTRRAVRRDEALAESDVRIEGREITGLRGEPLRKVAELAGRRASRSVQPGAVVTGDWLEAGPLVRRGDLVRAVAEVGPVLASTQVVALASGGQGDVIRVREEAGKGEFPARISGPGQVEVMLP